MLWIAILLQGVLFGAMFLLKPPGIPPQQESWLILAIQIGIMIVWSIMIWEADKQRKKSPK